ncbi:MAG TPA: hypothetical protein PLV92_08370 [Pirellulaceae bacterium]|nr:hypothetical protein [Pirellulaceae bacterium]
MATLAGGAALAAAGALASSPLASPLAAQESAAQKPAEIKPGAKPESKPSATPPAAGDEPDGDVALQFSHGHNLKFAAGLPPESDEAIKAFDRYLRDNARASEVLHRLQNQVRAFRAAAPRLFVSKCIDGRVHTSHDIGFPPTTVVFLRTEGTSVDLSANNSVFWNRLNGVILDAERHTPGCPALLLALGHRGVLGSGCAAHHEQDDKALATVDRQAAQLRRRYVPERLYTLHGMTNTDDHSLQLIFPDGNELDIELLLRELDRPDAPLRAPSELFRDEWLDRPVDDRETHELLGHRVPRDVLASGTRVGAGEPVEKQAGDARAGDARTADARATDVAPAFSDLQVMLSLESYFINEVSRLLRNPSRNNVVFQPRVLDAVRRRLAAVDGLPEELRPALVYIVIWNMAYCLHERRRIAAIKEPERRALELDHAEVMVAYGDGFEVEPRNTLVLVKPGRGNDLDALSVAKVVITKHRHKRRAQSHPPLVHINVEVSGQLDTWRAADDLVFSRLATMTANVHEVFQADCRVVTTYSYREQKRFYPVLLGGDPTTTAGDPRECYPCDLALGLNDNTFTHNDLSIREDAYTRSVLRPLSDEPRLR